MKFLLMPLIPLLISMLLLGLTSFINFSSNLFMESKGSPFECGFQPFSAGNLGFSLVFFMVSLMFLLFDVEIILITFYPIFFSYSIMFKINMFIILMLILLTTLYEWTKGVLVWA